MSVRIGARKTTGNLMAVPELSFFSVYTEINGLYAAEVCKDKGSNEPVVRWIGWSRDQKHYHFARMDVTHVEKAKSKGRSGKRQRSVWRASRDCSQMQLYMFSVLPFQGPLAPSAAAN